MSIKTWKLDQANKHYNYLIFGSGGADIINWTAWSWRSCTKETPAIMLKCIPSGSSSPGWSSNSWRFSGRPNMICCKHCKMVGRNLGNQEGLLRTFGGDKKNLIAGNDWQKVKSVVEPEKIFIKVWLRAPSPPLPSSPIPSTRQLVRKDITTNRIWKGTKKQRLK